MAKEIPPQPAPAITLIEHSFVECVLESEKLGPWPERRWAFGIKSPAIVFVLALWEVACEQVAQEANERLARPLYQALHGNEMDADWLSEVCGVQNGFHSMTNGIILELSQTIPHIVQVEEGTGYFKIAPAHVLERFESVRFNGYETVFCGLVRKRFKELIRLNHEEILRRTFEWSRVTHGNALA